MPLPVGPAHRRSDNCRQRRPALWGCGVGHLRYAECPRAPDYINYKIGFLGRWGTYACPQCLPSDTVPIRSWTRTLRPPGIRHRHLPYHGMVCTPYHTIPHVRATCTGKLTFRNSPVFGGQNTRALLRNTCSPAKHVLSYDLVPEPTTHATLNEVECSRAQRDFFRRRGLLYMYVCRRIRKCTVKCVASAYFLFPNFFLQRNMLL